MHRPLLTILLTVVLTVACTSPPVQEMSDARQAIQAAAEIGTDEHSEELARARALLAEAEAALRAHRFESARNAALDAHREAVAILRAHGAEAGTETGGDGSPP